MKKTLFLFCGGPAIDSSDVPKPLMKVTETQSLLACYLQHLEKQSDKPESLTLLCDDGQQAAILAEVESLKYSIPISVKSCGLESSTFEKFSHALKEVEGSDSAIRFGYPDIFFFGDHISPPTQAIESEKSIHISAAPITSRFPRLMIDIYTGEVKGISNYTSVVPANPMHVFAGDIWGKASQLSKLKNDFQSQENHENPTLEYDFFFWLINHQKVHCVMLHGDRLWVDSQRDVRQLRIKMGI